MVFLERFKGSGLLVEGFESFLREWYGGDEEGNQRPVEWSGTAAEAAGHLPGEVLRFYEVAGRRPGSMVLKNRHEVKFVQPPGFLVGPDGSIDRRWIPILRDDAATLLIRSTDGSLHREKHASGSRVEVAVPPAEVLVSHGLVELIFREKRVSSGEAHLEEASLIYTGKYMGDEDSVFVYYHEDGWLWVGEERFDFRVGYGSARRPPRP